MIMGAVSFLNRTSPLKRGVAIDGSLFHVHPQYQKFLFEGLALLDLDWGRGIEIIGVRQGSLVGGVCN